MVVFAIKLGNGDLIPHPCLQGCVILKIIIICLYGLIVEVTPLTQVLSIKEPLLADAGLSNISLYSI